MFRELQTGTDPRAIIDMLSAYILMAEKVDSNGDSPNNGKSAMFLRVAVP